MRFNKILVGTCVALVLTLGLAVGSPTRQCFCPKVRRQPKP